MARIRSPNYPSLSLPEALDRVKKIHDREQHLAAPREVIAAHLGYGGINGASAKVISAISKYGLLEDVAGDKVKVSKLAMSILYPSDPAEKDRAIREAALKPALFTDIFNEWEGQQPSDANLRSWLIRRNFASDALDRVIESYRETMGMVTYDGVGFDFPATRASSMEREPGPIATDARPSLAADASAQPLPSSGGSPFRLVFTPGSGLEGTFRLNSAAELDDLVTLLTGMRFIFKRTEWSPEEGS